MTFEEHGYCDIDKLQQKDNENYQRRYQNKSFKDYTYYVGSNANSIF